MYGTSYEGSPRICWINNMLEWSGDVYGTESVGAKQDLMKKIVVEFFCISHRTSVMKIHT